MAYMYSALKTFWIIDSLKMYKIADKVIKFTEKTMKTGEWNWLLEEKV